LKKFDSDIKHVVQSDHELHAIAAKLLSKSRIPNIISQGNSAESESPFQAVALPAQDHVVGLQRRNRPGVAQHFVQLARQWVARVESLQQKLAPLQRQLTVFDNSISLVKQHLTEAESQRIALVDAIKSSRNSVDAAQLLLDNEQTNRLKLQNKMARIAHEILAASGALLS
jgi:hypothetical protein